MEKYLFGEKLNGTDNTGIVEVKTAKLLCLCNKESADFILKQIKLANKYNELADKIGKFYDEDDNGSDLSDIGECAAIHFGYM